MDNDEHEYWKNMQTQDKKSRVFTSRNESQANQCY